MKRRDHVDLMTWRGRVLFRQPAFYSPALMPGAAGMVSSKLLNARWDAEVSSEGALKSQKLLPCRSGFARQGKAENENALDTWGAKIRLPIPDGATVSMSMFLWRVASGSEQRNHEIRIGGSSLQHQPIFIEKSKFRSSLLDFDARNWHSSHRRLAGCCRNPAVY